MSLPGTGCWSAGSSGSYSGVGERSISQVVSAGATSPHSRPQHAVGSPHTSTESELASERTLIWLDVVPVATLSCTTTLSSSLSSSYRHGCRCAMGCAAGSFPSFAAFCIALASRWRSPSVATPTSLSLASSAGLEVASRTVRSASDVGLGSRTKSGSRWKRSAPERSSESESSAMSDVVVLHERT